LKGKTASVRTLNDDHAKVYDVVVNFPFYRAHLNQILKELKPEKGGRYVDLGCGTGNFLYITKGTKALFVGVDFSAEMLKRAKRKAKNLVMADLHHLPFKNNCIDGVVNLNVFYQLNHPKAFIKEVHRILKPGAKFIISTPKPAKTPFRFIPMLVKTVITSPKIFTKLGKLGEMSDYNKIEQKIIDLKSDSFYQKGELEKMFKSFEIVNLKKTYEGQNWLVVARKPAE
jgi:ubiquinone/menaquinone biosynthesis C-methylase UbiE